MLPIKTFIKVVLIFVLLAIAIPFLNCCNAQNIIVVSKRKIYNQQVLSDSNYKMVELKTFAPLLVYDLRYATVDNFTHRRLYNQSRHTFVRLPVARALQQVEAALNKMGLGLKIFDAYRPYSVTKKMWMMIHDDRYVADPAKGSGHNRGIAVDLTLIDLNTGNEVAMGTDFDNFTDSAHHDFKNFSKEILYYRQLLRSTMEAAGFNPLLTEWWHYSWPNNRNYVVLDLDFKKLCQLAKNP